MSAPVKHTCPDIDKALKHIKTAWNEIKCVVEDRQTRNSIEWELDHVIDVLEMMRKSNDELRNWGEGLEEELQTAGEMIYELERKIPA